MGNFTIINRFQIRTWKWIYRLFSENNAVFPKEPVKFHQIWLNKFMENQHPFIHCDIHLPPVFCRQVMIYARSGALPGHRDVNTAMIYTHVLKYGPSGVKSPAGFLKQQLRFVHTFLNISTIDRIFPCMTVMQAFFIHDENIGYAANFFDNMILKLYPVVNFDRQP